MIPANACEYIRDVYPYSINYDTDEYFRRLHELKSTESIRDILMALILFDAQGSKEYQELKKFFADNHDNIYFETCPEPVANYIIYDEVWQSLIGICHMPWQEYAYNYKVSYELGGILCGNVIEYAKDIIAAFDYIVFQARIFVPCQSDIAIPKHLWHSRALPRNIFYGRDIGIWAFTHLNTGIARERRDSQYLLDNYFKNPDTMLLRNAQYSVRRREGELCCFREDNLLQQHNKL